MATKDKLVNLEDLKAVYDHGTELLEEKADQAGYYPDLIAGTADNLLSSSYQTDSTPYLLRRTPYGVRERGNIVGGSLVWNQLEQGRTTSSTAYGITFSYSDGLWTFSGTCTQTNIAFRLSNNNKPIQTGHKILLTNTSSTFKVRLQGFFPSTSASTPWGRILEAQDGAVNDIVVMGFNMDGVAVNETDRFGIIDLTLMFGPTIADYIYSQERATAGAGVALAKAWAGITAAYYPYDAGSIKSVTGLTAHRMTGFNQWDEEWEVGMFNNSTGEKMTATVRMRNKNPIRISPQMGYYLNFADYRIGSLGLDLYFYDSSGSFLSYFRKWSSNLSANQIPSGASYMNFCTQPEYGTTYKHDICINLSDPSRNGQYEPYTVHTYPLDSSLTLRGLPKLDGDNLYYDGDVYKADGTVERRYGVVDLGTINYNMFSDFFYASFSGRAPNENAICSKFVNVGAKSDSGMANVENWSMAPMRSANGQIKFKCTDYTTTASFKTAMSGVYLIYELAEPTTEQAEPYTELQICDPNGTEEYIDTRDVPIPVGHNTKYMRDLKKLLEGIPDAPTTNGTYTLKVTVSGGVATYSWG